MEWTRSETIALASPSCAHCHGLGLLPSRKKQDIPCACVLRSIFRHCHTKFLFCASKEKHLSRVSMELSPRGTHRATWGRKNEEYCADFLLVTRRTLTPQEYQIFNWHYLLGADWKLVSRKTGMDRGNFFHTIYRIQQKLGRTFSELRPYPLYPLDDYFYNNKPHEDPLETARRFFERQAA
jgi:hypothetical protein